MLLETGNDLESGNTVDEAYDPSLLPGGRPYLWGDKCTRISIGGTNGGATAYRSFTPGYTTKFVSQPEVMIVSTSIVDGTSISLDVLKAEGSRHTAPLCTRLYFARSGANYKFNFAIDQDGDEVIVQHPAAGSLNLEQVYRHRITWDIAGTLIEWVLDGVVIDSRTLVAGNPQTVGHHVRGSSASSDGRNTVFALRAPKKWILD